MSRESTPRRWTTQPDLFGRIRIIDWEPGERQDQAAIRAAKQQHTIVLAVRHAMSEVGVITDADLAIRLGYSAAQIGRVLRGEAAISLRMIAELELTLNASLLALAANQNG